MLYPSSGFSNDLRLLLVHVLSFKFKVRKFVFKNAVARSFFYSVLLNFLSTAALFAVFFGIEILKC